MALGLMRIALHFVVAFVLSLGLVRVWVYFAMMFKWSYFTGWGMAHGGLVIALPICFLVSFGALYLVPWIRKAWNGLSGSE